MPPATRARGARDPERVHEVVTRLHDEYVDAETALDHQTDWELLVATILSAQCTDARVNMVTPALFQRYPTPEALAAAETPELEGIIHSTGFFRAKARSLKGMCAAVAGEHGGTLPREMDALTRLPGVGRKTANVVRGSSWGLPAVIVDTHCSRVSQRLGWTRQEDPVRIEQDLMKLLPEEEWTFTSHSFVLHGRAVCHARKPRCNACVLGQDLCPSYDPAAPD